MKHTIGLRLYYLRTRRMAVTQAAMGKALGIRQATISNLEQGAALPGLPLLLTLCEYFGVTPTYLCDPDCPLEPGPSELWENRHGLVTSGQYVELPHSAVRDTGAGTYVVALQPGAPAYDEEALRTRLSRHRTDLVQSWRSELGRRQRLEKQLRTELEGERSANRLRRAGMSRSKAEKLSGL